MRTALALIALCLLGGCRLSEAAPAVPSPPEPARDAKGFPLPDRPVAGIVAPTWSSGPDRDAADESGQLIRALGIRRGMAVADIGAGSGYHTLRLSPVVGPEGVIYAEDIVEAYISGLRREAERRNLTNVRIVVGSADDPKLPAASVDRAVLVHMYHEIENPYVLLWNLATALKPGARVGVIDLDRATESHGTPRALLKCEFEAVGYRRISHTQMTGGGGYIAVFEAPTTRPAPQDIKACPAKG
jgi:ubiquinone/menaquinone biosynthesis C-methylase UbiE